MDKNRLKIASAVLDSVKSRCPEAQEFIDSALKKEFEKEKLTADDVIFLLLNLQQQQQQQN